jgi:hypothetical protein
LGSVVNDALADSLEVFDLAVAKVCQDIAQPVDILLFLLLPKLLVRAELE